MLLKKWFVFLLCAVVNCAAFADNDSDEQSVLVEAVDFMIDDIKLHGPDALLFGEDFESNREFEMMFAKAYDAGVNFLAYGINVEAKDDTLKSKVKCGLRLDRHDTKLRYRRSDISRGEVAEFETGAKFYLSFMRHW